MKNIVILGSTGSIGTQALEIVAASEELSVVGLAVGSSWEAAVEQARQHGVPTLALAEATGARLLPVDSEHSALFQLIRGEAPGTVTKLVLTASGGPFRGRTDLESVTPEEALAHPTWDMGGRITVDCATLMNKGFEAIEAHHFFAVPYERIDVVVHPQSIVHSLIHLNDGAALAHMGLPDMRVPISYALHFPERADTAVSTLDLAETGELSFEAPDLDAFPCLRLAFEAGETGGTAPCVLNAADEVAVAAFLEGHLSFPAIAEVVERTLAEMPAETPTHFEDLFAVDAEARRRSGEMIEELAPA